MDFFDLRLWEGFKAAGGDTSMPALVNQVAIDSRQIESNSSLFIALKGKETDGHQFVIEALDFGAKYAIVRSSYIQEYMLSPSKLLYVDNPIKALQEIAKAYRNQLPTKIVAITGSYGKTMVKDLLKEMLMTTFCCEASPESFNSQIGVPLSLFTLSKNHEIAIIEAAISEKNEMEFIADMLTPDFGIITPIGKKHIDRLENIPSLIKELLKLFQTSRRLKWLSLPNNQELTPFFNDLAPHLHFWNQKEPKTPFAESLTKNYALSMPYQITFPDQFSYQGHITSGFHYYLDLLNMTVKAAFQLGVPREQICKTLDGYVLEPIKKEIWKSPQGVTFINDSYAEDPLSIDQALKFLKNNSGNGRKIFLFEGLKGKKQASDYKRVGTLLGRYKLDLLILIGSHDFDPLIEPAENGITTIIKAKSYQEAFSLYHLLMHSSDTVLLKGTKKEPLDEIITYFHESLCTSLCLINLAAIEHNIKILRKKIPASSRMMVMVKALAYGTDDFRIAKFLQTCGIDILGVSYVEEGVSLKRAGVNQSIFVLHAADYEIEKVIKWDLEVGVSTIHQIELFSSFAKKQERFVKVHLHVDTGMGRFGCRREEALTLAKAILKEPSLILEGIMTHFACADDPTEDHFTRFQAEQLSHIIQTLKEEGIEIKWKHAANTAGTLRFSFPEFNMVRIGLAVFGLIPSYDLRHSVSLISRIAGINNCKKGETISYGRSYIVEEEEKKIAVLPIGYFDGIHRNYSGKGHVLIRGQKAKMIGKICMDFMMVDVSTIADVQEGDPVLIFGEDDRGNYLSPEEFATQGNSIIHELISCLGPRIQRIFIYEESKEIHV